MMDLIWRIIRIWVKTSIALNCPSSCGALNIVSPTESQCLDDKDFHEDDTSLKDCTWVGEVTVAVILIIRVAVVRLSFADGLVVIVHVKMTEILISMDCWTVTVIG